MSQTEYEDHCCHTINKKLKRKNEKLSDAYHRLRSQMKTIDAKGRRLQSQVNHLLASLNNYKKSFDSLLDSIPGTDPNSSSDSSDASESNDASSYHGQSSVKSVTLSNASTIGETSLNFDAKTPSQMGRVAEWLSPNKSRHSTASSEVRRYHQCVLCGWHDKASNRNMSRHYKDKHSNYRHDLSDAKKSKSLFYFNTDAPYSVWPTNKAIPWHGIWELIGVNGVNCTWLTPSLIQFPKDNTSSDASTERSITPMDYNESSSDESELSSASKQSHASAERFARTQVFSESSSDESE